MPAIRAAKLPCSLLETMRSRDRVHVSPRREGGAQLSGLETLAGLRMLLLLTVGAAQRASGALTVSVCT